MTGKWWQEAAVYQVYPRSFQDSNGDGIGDINGIRKRLGYIKDLGADVIWLCPIYRSPNADNGYDISDYQEIMEEFGTMEDFDCLLKEAHEGGLKIILDLVVNHSSDEHRWFRNSRSSEKSPYRDFYYWRKGSPDIPPNNWGSAFGGPAWTYDTKTQSWYLHLFAEKQPDLNWENPQVRESVYEMMRWWLDKGVDGFRMDVINYISKVPGLPDGPVDPEKDNRFGCGLYGDFEPEAANGPRVHEFLQEMNEKVLSRYDIMTVGETAGITIEHGRKYAGFDTHELNMVFEFEHMNLDYGKYGMWSDNRVPLTALKASMTKWQDGMEGFGWNSLFWGNHDHPRMVSRFGNDSEEFREICAKMLALCLYGMKGTPFVFQGDELGMTNVQYPSMEDYQDVQTRGAYEVLVQQQGVPEEEMMRYVYAKSRDNSRTPMQWDDSPQAGFTEGTPWLKVNPNYRWINVEAQQKNPESVLNFYKKLLAFRKQDPVLLYGQYRLLDPENEELYAYLRESGEGIRLVACNFTDREIAFDAKDYPVKGIKLIGNYADQKEGTLRPYEGIIFG